MKTHYRRLTRADREKSQLLAGTQQKLQKAEAANTRLEHDLASVREERDQEQGERLRLQKGNAELTAALEQERLAVEDALLRFVRQTDTMSDTYPLRPSMAPDTRMQD